MRLQEIAGAAADTINKALPDLTAAAQAYHDAVSSFKDLLADDKTYTVDVPSTVTVSQAWSEADSYCKIEYYSVAKSVCSESLH